MDDGTKDLVQTQVIYEYEHSLGLNVIYLSIFQIIIIF